MDIPGQGQVQRNHRIDEAAATLWRSRRCVLVTQDETRFDGPPGTSVAQHGKARS